MRHIKYNPFLHTHLRLKKEMIREFERFYNDQSYILGAGLDKFEKQYAAYTGTNFAVGIGNGHDALLIALKCMDIGPGDEVIIPAHTFIATGLAIVNAGAIPIMVDIDPQTLNIDSLEIEQNITKKTKAIIPVHLYGNPCEMNNIKSIAQKYQLHIIEDNAQAHGAVFQGQKTGSFGIIGITSFYPTKNLGALGDGGMITTNSQDLAKKAKALRNYGRFDNATYKITGFNSRLDELQARLLSVKLKYLDVWNNQRIEIANLYQSQLKEIIEIQFQTTYTYAKNVRHIFPVLTKKRDMLKSYLLSKGIETLIHYEKPIHLHESFSFLNLRHGCFPEAERICRMELSLPIYPGLKEEDVVYVCTQIKKFFAKS